MPDTTIFNITDIASKNATTNNTSLGNCPMKIPLPMLWSMSSSNEATKVSTILCISVNILTMPLTLFLNALIIIVVWKNASLHVERVVVLACLALTDFLVGLISQPLFIAKETILLKNGTPSCAVESAYLMSMSFLLGTSLYQLAVVTYERYIAIIHPYEYPTRITVKKLIYTTIGLLATNFALGTLFSVFSAKNVSSNIEIFMIMFIAFIMLCIVYWYVHIFAAIRRQNRQIVQQQQNVNMNNPHTKQNHKGAITAVLLVGCFLFCFLPLMITVTLKTAFGSNFVRGSSLFLSLHSWFETFVLLSSFFNPIIYSLRTTKLRAKCLAFLGLQNNVMAVQNAFVLQPK